MPFRHLEQALPAWDRSQGVPRSYVTTDGTISFYFDQAAYDFHIDASPGYKASTMKTVLQQVQWWGLELMDEDECPPELLPGGITRIYLTPIVPVEVTEAEWMAELLAEADALTQKQERDLFEPEPTGPRTGIVGITHWYVNVFQPYMTVNLPFFDCLVPLPIM